MSSVPTGTITFLFTDVEGSTKLWELDPQTMRAALDRHYAILQQTIDIHGGVVFKTVGDGVCAAFARAPDALNAALAAQRLLHNESWNTIIPLRVRMALHTGTVDVHDGDYYGLPLSRVARILAAGYGGQIILSRTTYDLVCDDLPLDTDVRDLGEHRLKDLIRPERIFQLTSSDLPSDFPRLKTLESRPNNLPAQPTALIGREKEIAAVSALFQQEGVRLLVLTGPGGTGKTRLGLQVAAELLDVFEDGVYFVTLAPISDPELVPSTIAQTIGVIDNGSQPISERLKNYLRDKQMLLLLDNFEQVVIAAPFLTELLEAAPRLKILVTSREVLHVYGEHDFHVPPLNLPNPKYLPSFERLTQYEAVRLFIERARAVQTELVVTNENAPAIAEICARLDGLPLAIELAAARITLFAPQALLSRLERRLRLLTSGARNLPIRQQTLRSTIDWSYGLLDAAEQTLFSRLGVFVGGCTLDAAEAICNAEGDLSIDVLDGIASLIDKSLLRQETGMDGEARYVMLETAREYALERLETSKHKDSIQRQHMHFFVALAEAAEPELRRGQQVAWLNRLETEHDNLRAGLSWALEHRESQLALRLCAALWFFWGIRGHLSEGRKWLEMTLRSNTTPTSTQAKAHIGAGWLALTQGDYDAMRTFYEQGLAIGRELGDKQIMALALAFGAAAFAVKGDFATTNSMLRESLALARKVDDSWIIGVSLHNLGEAFRVQGDNAAAEPLYEEALLVWREMGDKLGCAYALFNLGNLVAYQEDYTRACTYFIESMRLFQELGNEWGIAWCLWGSACLAAMQRHGELAAQLFGAAQALANSIGADGMERDAPVLYARAMAAIREQLDEEALTAAWAEGCAMSQGQAIALALTLPQAEPSIRTQPRAAVVTPTLHGLASLTPREIEVLRLVATGLTNAQVAEKLVISSRTVNAHLNSIYGKLGVSSRSAATRFAVDNRIV